MMLPPTLSGPCSKQSLMSRSSLVAVPATNKTEVPVFGWVFFLIPSAHLHVRPMGLTCG